ncbi:hypothetical protein KFE25_005316 [Diacronema lutheri]|uniref:FYVE-type domain-containing protein n=1 Tax=Diacronema lutheri TaxID=2081491 RepID=A0A8J5XBR8_DIALT|nr:hypothetical protein KFE25_005316 [Diacronema lutheri]
MATPAVEWNTTHWVPDEAVSECAAPTCGRPFNRLLRKHHCRRCGRVFCAQCTSHKLHLTPQLAVDSERGVAPSKAGLRVGARPPATARAWRVHGAAP